MKTFSEWMKTVEQSPFDTNSFGPDPHKMLYVDYSPSIQIQSGVDKKDRDYFSHIFGKGVPSKKELFDFIHEQPEAGGTFNSNRNGIKMVIYSNGKIVMGKAPYHAELIFRPDPGSTRLEGYFIPKSKTIRVTNGRHIDFFNASTWKTALGNLLRSGLVDEGWTIFGCPPDCDEPSKGMLVGDLMRQHGELIDSKKPSAKETETQYLVQNFKDRQAIQNRGQDLKRYMYRHGE